MIALIIAMVDHALPLMCTKLTDEDWLPPPSRLFRVRTLSSQLIMVRSRG